MRYNMQFANRMQQFGEGVFARLAAMKKQKISEGCEVIDLSIGAPNIPPPQHVMKIFCHQVHLLKNCRLHLPLNFGRSKLYSEKIYHK